MSRAVLTDRLRFSAAKFVNFSVSAAQQKKLSFLKVEYTFQASQFSPPVLLRRDISIMFSVPLPDARSGSIVRVISSAMPLTHKPEVNPFFYNSSIRFVRGQQRGNLAVVEIQVGLRLSRGLQTEDSISISLPSFGPPNTAQLPKILRTDANRYRFSVSWEPVHQQLVMALIDGLLWVYIAHCSS